MTFEARDVDEALEMGKAVIFRAAANSGVPLGEVIEVARLSPSSNGFEILHPRLLTSWESKRCSGC